MARVRLVDAMTDILKSSFSRSKEVCRSFISLWFLFSRSFRLKCSMVVVLLGQKISGSAFPVELHLRGSGRINAPHGGTKPYNDHGE